MNAAAILDNLNGQGPVRTILGLQLVADPNVTATSGTNGVAPIYVYRAQDLMFFNSGPFTQVHYDTYSGLISRFPHSIVKISGFAWGS